MAMRFFHVFHFRPKWNANQMRKKWSERFAYFAAGKFCENLMKSCATQNRYSDWATFIHSKSLMKGNIVVGLMEKGWLKKHRKTSNFMCGKSSRETGDGNKTLSFLAFPVGTTSFHSGTASQMLIAWNAPDHLETSHVKRFGAFTVNIMTWNVISDIALSQQLDLNSMLCQSTALYERLITFPHLSISLSIVITISQTHLISERFNSISFMTKAKECVIKNEVFSFGRHQLVTAHNCLSIWCAMKSINGRWRLWRQTLGISQKNEANDVPSTSRWCVCSHLKNTKPKKKMLLNWNWIECNGYFCSVGFTWPFCPCMKPERNVKNNLYL